MSLIIYYIIIAVVLTAISALIQHFLTPRPDTQSAKPPTTGAFNFPTAQEGRPIPVIFGTAKVVGPNVIWYGDFAYAPLRTVVSGADNFTSGYQYYFGMDIALCRGPIDGISEIFYGDDLDNPLVAEGYGYVSGNGTPTGTEFEVIEHSPKGNRSSQDLIDGTFTFYPGTSTQSADAYVSAKASPTTTNTVVVQFGIEEETTGNYWVRNTATKDKFGQGVNLAEALLVEAGDTIILGNVNRLVNGSGATPGPAYTNLSGEIAEVDGATGDLRVVAGSEIADQVDIDTGIVYVDATEQWAGAIYANMEIVPTYAGVAHLVWSNDTRDGPGQFGQKSNIEPIVAVVHRYPRPVAIQPGIGDVGILAPDAYGRGDANPVFCLYEILTDTLWGAGVPEAHVNQESFRAAAVTVYQEGLGFSFTVDQEQDASKLTNVLLEHMSGVLHQDDKGQLTLSLVRKSSNEERAAARVLDVDNIISLVSYSRLGWGETANSVRVEFDDRTRDWKPASANAMDQGNIAMLGREQNTSFKATGCTTAPVAARIAQRLLQQGSFPLTTLSVKTIADGAHMFPSQLVKVTWPNLGIENRYFRVTGSDEGTQTVPERTVTMTEDVFQFNDSPVFVAGPNNELISIPSEITPPAATSAGAVPIPSGLAYFREPWDYVKPIPSLSEWTVGTAAPAGFNLSTVDSTRLLDADDSPPRGALYVVAPDPEDNHPDITNPPQTAMIEQDFTGVGDAYEDPQDVETTVNSNQMAYDGFWTVNQQNRLGYEIPVNQNWADPDGDFDPLKVQPGVIAEIRTPLSSLFGITAPCNTLEKGAGSMMNRYQMKSGVPTIIAGNDSLGPASNALHGGGLEFHVVLPASTATEAEIQERGRGLWLVASDLSDAKTHEWMACEQVWVGTPGRNYWGTGSAAIPKKTEYTLVLPLNVRRGMFGSDQIAHPPGTPVYLMDEDTNPATFVTGDKADFTEGTAVRYKHQTISQYGETTFGGVNALTTNEWMSGDASAQADCVLMYRTRGSESSRKKVSNRSRNNPEKYGWRSGNLIGSTNRGLQGSNTNQDAIGNTDIRDYFVSLDNSTRGSLLNSCWFVPDGEDFGVSWANRSPHDGIYIPNTEPLRPPANLRPDTTTIFFHVIQNPDVADPFKASATSRQLVGSAPYYMNADTNVETVDIQSPGPGAVYYYNASGSTNSAGNATERGATQGIISVDGLFASDAQGGVAPATWLADSAAFVGGKTGIFVIMNIRVNNGYFAGTSTVAPWWPTRWLFIETP